MGAERTRGHRYAYAEAEALRRRLEPVVRRMRQCHAAMEELTEKMRHLRRTIEKMGGCYAWQQTLQLVHEWNRYQDQLRGLVEELRRHHVEVRDIAQGLVDIPGVLDGKPIFWCWKPDEAVILYYHDVESGFAGRKPVPDRVRSIDGTREE